MENLERAAAALKKGKIVIIYDGDQREGEADMVFHASFATSQKIAKLRKEAGGLICLALGKKEGELLRLPFYTDLLRNCTMSKISCKKTPYGDEPAFSISVNHRKTYTGITDEDRALTAKEMALCLAKKEPYDYFVKNFYSPGHLFLLKSRGIEKRKGHTELATTLAAAAKKSEAVVLCEMLSNKKALTKKEAYKYAKKEGLVFIEGKEIVKWWKNENRNS
ncbi:MAG: 3,4-dihydroxy-2-butanone-4-phosphate synthase [Candidatus Bilamarchaeaceae archaeon]